MRSPPLAPSGFDADVYLVLDDFGQIGRVYREADENEADRAAVIRDLKCGQFNNPVRVVCFNTAQGTSRDVKAEIAEEIQSQAEYQGDELSPGLREFIDLEAGRTRRMAQ